MLQITKSEMISKLERDLVRNCCNIIEIERGGSEFYLSSSNDDDYFIVYDFGREPFYDVITNNEDFFAQCVEYISKKNGGNAALSVTNQEFLNSPILLDNYWVGTVRPTYDARLLDPPKDLNAGISIRKLTKNDQEIAQKFVYELEKGRPPFPFVFEYLVERDNGIIYVVIENQEITAFLSCYSVCEGIYDVDYIYVIPEKRRTGLGTELIKVYAHDIVAKGCAPIYNQAVNEPSVNAAIKAGFTIIRTLHNCSLYRLSRLESENLGCLA